MANTTGRSGGHAFEEYKVTALAATAATELETVYKSDSPLIVQQQVTAISGTGAKITTKLEDSVDGTNWNEVTAFTAAEATGVAIKKIKANEYVLGPKVRLNHVIAGTEPKVTATLVVYGTPA